MKLVIFFVVFIGVAFAAPQFDWKSATIEKYENDNKGLGEYKFEFKSSDQTSRKEEGKLKNAGTENEALEVRGRIDWIAPDEQFYTLTYIANENGFQPSGIHLPEFKRYV